ncbi:MAG: hypothetical protein HY796_12850 [Elusimicrobia bacterium]|nr:hypothetical protein [Elusimicrobiota bacterium]
MIFNDLELMRILKHFGLPADFPEFPLIPREIAGKYSHRANGPPDDDCQLAVWGTPCFDTALPLCALRVRTPAEAPGILPIKPGLGAQGDTAAAFPRKRASGGKSSYCHFFFSNKSPTTVNRPAKR